MGGPNVAPLCNEEEPPPSQTFRWCRGLFVYVRDGGGFIPRVRLNGGEKDPKVCRVEGSREADNIQPVYYFRLFIRSYQVQRTRTEQYWVDCVGTL